jgi:hypothetical protein
MHSGYFVSVLLAFSAAGAAAQTARGDLDTTVVVVDPGDVLGSARSAQAAFERARERHLPVRLGGSSGDCDEVIGRFCVWYGEGEWFPPEESDELRTIRAEFLETLDSLQALAPGDAWILGQRVWYRVEAGGGEEALAVARGCARAPAWWCAALEGLALHALRRFADAEVAFDSALIRMDPELALEWRTPEREVDGDGRQVLATLVTAADGSLDRVLERMWSLADPLYLVEGNDRKTAHYARWTVATLKEDARNPFRMRWGRDLQELTLRHGWEVGWHRARGGRIGQPDDIVGHSDPERREYMPTGRAFADPTAAPPEDFVADRDRPRSLYAPPYAPILLPMDAQLARFPRGERMVVVASHFLPEDTTYHADHDHPKPWLDPGDQAGMADRIGVFAVPVDGGETIARSLTGSTDGALALEIPAGAWVLSAESWSPERRRAGRQRLVIDHVAAAPGSAMLSDLLLLAPSPEPPDSLPDALPWVLPAPEIQRGDSLAVAWEVSGLGYRPESLGFELTVERTRRSVFRRLGEVLWLASPPTSVALSWEEAGPDRPEPAFRHIDLALPNLDEGLYEVTVTLRTQGRQDAVARREFRVR